MFIINTFECGSWLSFDGCFILFYRSHSYRGAAVKSWQQHPTRHQLYGHLPPITKTIQVRRTRHAGHCWRSRDELIRDVLLWIPTHGRAKAGRPARTYIQQLCEDTGCCPEDLPRAMNDREEWRERVRDIRAASTIWWWWWWWLIRRELFYIVWQEEIYTFPLLQVSKLCPSFSYNCGGEFWYSDTTNIQRKTFKSSIR